MWINIVLFTFLYELMAMNDKIIGNEKNIIFYNDEDGNAKIEVLLENENVWLTQIAYQNFLILLETILLFILVIFIKKQNWKKIQLVRISYKFKLKEIELLSVM